MLKRETRFKLLLAVCFISLAPPALGQTGLVNGDFSADLDPERGRS